MNGRINKLPIFANPLQIVKIPCEKQSFEEVALQEPPSGKVAGGLGLQ